MSSSHHQGRRRRSRRRASSTEPHLVCTATLAVVCLLTVVVILAVRPQWKAPLLGQPLGAFLLGGLGGLITLGCVVSWPRRAGPQPGRIVSLTIYRLGCATALGGAGFALADALVSVGDARAWLPLSVSFVTGLLEKPLNDGVLKATGLVTTQKSGPRAG